MIMQEKDREVNSIDELKIDAMKLQDKDRVLEIYEESIEHDDATYLTKLPTWREWDESHDPNLRFVAKIGERIVGFVVVGKVFTSLCYRGVGEISIYVESTCRYRGVGTRLLEKMITESEQMELHYGCGYHTLQARIFTNNKNSIALHEKVGFRLVGRRERIMQKRGKWRDVYVYERRTNLF